MMLKRHFRDEYGPDTISWKYSLYSLSERVWGFGMGGLVDIRSLLDRRLCESITWGG